MDGGFYWLLIELPRETFIEIGKLGRFTFRKGWYVYTGSAKRNLIARIERHHRREKALHWHIDYLLEHAAIRETHIHRLKGNDECSLAGEVMSWKGAEILVPRFGASDCRCPAHLVYFRFRPSVKTHSA